MPYLKIDPSKLILRDHLAFERTILANERTLLAYVRTAIGLLAAGATVLKIFSDSPYSAVLGPILMGLGLLVLFFGSVQFFRVNRRIQRTYRDPSS